MSVGHCCYNALICIDTLELVHWKESTTSEVFYDTLCGLLCATARTEQYMTNKPEEQNMNKFNLK